MSPAQTHQQFCPAMLARDAIAALKDVPGVVGVCLVGSVARGDYRPESDVDILVVVTRHQTANELRDELPHHLRNHRLSLICESREALNRLGEEGSLFLAHARIEGRVVYDPERFLDAAFQVSAQTTLNASREMDSRVASLRHYRHLDRFGGNFLFALAHLYGLGKGVAIARTAQSGTPTFIKSRALAQLATTFPYLRKDVEAIQRLRPFYDLTRGHRVTALPFSYIDADNETRQAVQAVRHIAGVPSDETHT